MQKENIFDLLMERGYIEQVTHDELRETLGNDKIGDKTPEIWVFQGGKLIVSTADFYNEEDGCIYFHCGKAGHRLDALQKHDKVSFCVFG